MKKTTKLALNPSSIRILTGSALTRASGGISGPRGCNMTYEECDPTFDTCDISYAPNCYTGSCNSLACTTA